MPKSRSETFLELIYYEIKEFGRLVRDKFLNFETRISDLEDRTDPFRADEFATDPATPVPAQIWLNTTTNELKYFDGAQVKVVGEGEGGISFEERYTDYLL